jgi:quinol monooxygenase YgiN
VLVTVTYRVPEERESRFLEAMEQVRRSRQRTGASRWDLYQDGADRHQFVETFVVPSWAEHLRQHGERLTGADQALEERAIALADGPPEVQHLFTVQPRP